MITIDVPNVTRPGWSGGSYICRISRKWNRV